MYNTELGHWLSAKFRFDSVGQKFLGHFSDNPRNVV